jgi:hypothetical protein
MSSESYRDNSILNLPDAPATVLLRASDLAAILQEVQSLREIVKEHEMRLDKHGEYIRELRFREEPEPGPKQKDRREILQALLVVNSGKMFASDARKRMDMDEASFSRLVSKMGDLIEVKKSKVNKRRNLLVLRSEKG